jgi:VWFA-related protein
MRVHSLLLSAALAMFAAPLEQGQETPTIKVDVNVVNILCSVRDSRGALVADLGKDDFQVLEEGKPQEIRYFARETDLPLTLGLLVDVSRSQEHLIEIERRTAYQFLSRVLHKQDLAFLISFGAEAELIQDLTGSVALLRDGLDQLKLSAPATGLQPGPVPTVYQPRGTILFDAVYLAATEKLRSEVGRKAIVIITDGVDEGSRLKLEDAIEAAQKADTIVYSIYYFDPSAYGGMGGFGAPSDGDLRRMSEETGGREFKVSKNNPLEDIFRQIQEEMRSQYSLGYVPTNSARDSAFRRVDVRTRLKGLKVQARKGYYAVKQ